MNWIIAIFALVLAASLAGNYIQHQVICDQRRIIYDAQDWIDPICVDRGDGDEA